MEYILFAQEIIRKEIYNEKSDIYSFGCIIYGLINFSKYYHDKEYEEVNAVNSNKYNNNCQGIIILLFEIDFNKRINIIKLYDNI